MDPDRPDRMLLYADSRPPSGTTPSWSVFGRTKPTRAAVSGPPGYSRGGRLLVVDPWDVQGGDLVPRLRRHGLGDVGEPAGPGQGLLHRGDRLAEQRGQRLRGPRDSDNGGGGPGSDGVSRDLGLVDGDVAPIDGDRQRCPAGVLDLPAGGGQRLGGEAAAEGLAGQRGRVEPLDPQQLRGEQGEDEQHDHEHPAHPLGVRPTRGSRRVWGRLGGRPDGRRADAATRGRAPDARPRSRPRS